MERIIKIQSENGWSGNEIPRVGAFNSNRLLDYIIPGNATYDLSKSFVTLNMGIVNAVPVGAAIADYTADDTAAFNSEIVFLGDLTADDHYLSDTASLVRNAQMQSQNRGMVESIRRVDSLRQILWALENDKKEKQDGLDKIGTFQGRRGTGNQTSSLLQTVIRNTNNADVVDASRTSKGLNRDFRIPLSDLFGVGNSMWNGNVYGDTRIHLELNLDRLRIARLGGSESADNGPDGATKYGQLVAKPAQPLGTALNTVTTSLLYKDYQLNFPFYVGQAVEINAATAPVAGGVAVAIPAARRIIASIQYQQTNNANPPGGQEQMEITFRSSWYTTVAAENITDININALQSNALLNTIRLNKAEIVLSEMVGVDGPDEIDYRTYTTEEQNGNNAANYFHQYTVEGNAQNLIVASCTNGEITPANPWGNYRIAVDNVDQTGNRSVEYGHSLHQDRILRFMNNRGQNIDAIGLVAINTSAVQTNGALRPNQQPIYPILETLPLKSSPKNVTLQISAAGGVNDVILYKEVVRTI